MNFIEAVKLGVENGKKIKRDYWTCQCIDFVDFGNALVVSTEKEFVRTGKEFREKYIPTSTDILADDWELCEEKPKTVNFQEAFKALKSGKKIKRHSRELIFYKNFPTIYWEHDFIYISYKGKTIRHFSYKGVFSYDEINAIDWIILDDNAK